MVTPCYAAAMNRRPRLPALLVVLAGLAGGGCQQATAVVLGVDRIDVAGLQDARERTPLLVLLDVRNREDWLAGHIPGAIPAPPSELEAVLAELGKSRPRPPLVVTVCYRGNLSLAAASAVREHAAAVASLSGGMEAWRAAGLPVEKSTAYPERPPAPHVPLTLRDQVAATASGLVIKPFYMLLTLLVILRLRRTADSSVRRLRQALAWFLAGEVVCAIEFLMPGTHIAMGLRPVDLGHGAGMVIMGMLLPWALFELLDRRVLNLSDPEHACAVQRFCGRCWKRNDHHATCGVKQLFLVVAPVLAAVSLLPLTLPLRPIHQVSRVFSTVVDFGMPLGNQVVEFRLYPIAAALCFLIATFALRGGIAGMRRAQKPFFLGLGLMTFSLMRFLLEYAFQHAPVWADFWEEVTELGTVLGVTVTLIVFRRQLGLVRTAAAPLRP